MKITGRTLLLDSECDCVLFVADNFCNQTGDLESIGTAIKEYSQINNNLTSGAFVIPFAAHPSKRLVYAPTGPLNRDYDDVRRVYDAAIEGVKLLVKAGSKNPLLVLGSFDTAPTYQAWTDKNNMILVAVLGALQGLYTPIEVREAVPSKASKVSSLSVLNAGTLTIRVAEALEEGRRVARDIGGSDPERMSAQKIAAYIVGEFGDSGVIKVTVKEVDEKAHPLMAAVNRCASTVSRHDGRVVELEYTGEAEVTESLFLVGKGITYDTGGADIKAGGVMAGMHRDKCGAAAVTGFFKVLSLLKPAGLKATGLLAFVRNSVGSNAYVADEIITARSMRRVRIGNTDAEGRMVMADLLCEAKEKAVNAVNPFLFTVATLTGHVIRAYGPDYTAAMDNGKAHHSGVANKLQAAGDMLAEPVEISRIRRDDYAAHKAKSEYADILQANNQPSTMTSRGHMTPSAFLIMASGLDDHGLDSKKPLAYTHLDCAGSSGPFPGIPTGAPISALVGHFVLPKIH